MAEAPRTSRGLTSRAGWIFLFIDGSMLGAVSLGWLVRGRVFDRELYETIGGVSWTLMRALDASVIKLVSMLVRVAGALGVVTSILAIAISVVPYRRGERWAWYAMWALPLGSTLDLAVLAAYGGLSLRVALWDVQMLAFSLVGLVLPYRVFFGETSGERNEPSRNPRTSPESVTP